MAASAFRVLGGSITCLSPEKRTVLSVFRQADTFAIHYRYGIIQSPYPTPMMHSD